MHVNMNVRDVMIKHTCYSNFALYFNDRQINHIWGIIPLLCLSCLTQGNIKRQIMCVIYAEL